MPLDPPPVMKTWRDLIGILTESRPYDQSQDDEKRNDEESEDKEERRNGRHV